MNDLPLVSNLKTRMHLQQTRQKLIAENVANADTPGFKPKDLKDTAGPGKGARIDGLSLAVAQTSPMHMTAGASNASETTEPAQRFETRPSGNGVNLEAEMLKSAENQADYQLATSLYQKSLAMLRTAAGAKS